MRVTNFNSLLSYLSFNFIWGCLLDLLVMPAAVLMFLIKALCKIPLNDLLHHDYSKQPVILIHGSGSNEMQWLPCWLFYLRNRYNVYTIQLNQLMGDKQQTIEHMTVHLADLMGQIDRDYIDRCSDERNHSFTLVGHSMGGLVASMTAENTNFNIQKIITINSPHCGAPALNFINFGTARHMQMKPGSKFLAKLHRLQKKSKIDYICYGSYYDFQVPAPHTWSKKCKKILHNYGHTSAIFFPDVWRYL